MFFSIDKGYWKNKEIIDITRSNKHVGVLFICNVPQLHYPVKIQLQIRKLSIDVNCPAQANPTEDLSSDFDPYIINADYVITKTGF